MSTVLMSELATIRKAMLEGLKFEKHWMDHIDWFLAS